MRENLEKMQEGVGNIENLQQKVLKSKPSDMEINFDDEFNTMNYVEGGHMLAFEGSHNQSAPILQSKAESYSSSSTGLEQ